MDTQADIICALEAAGFGVCGTTGTTGNIYKGELPLKTGTNQRTDPVDSTSTLPDIGVVASGGVIGNTNLGGTPGFVGQDYTIYIRHPQGKAASRVSQRILELFLCQSCITPCVASDPNRYKFVKVAVLTPVQDLGRDAEERRLRSIAVRYTYLVSC